MFAMEIAIMGRLLTTIILCICIVYSLILTVTVGEKLGNPMRIPLPLPLSKIDSTSFKW